MKHIHEHDGRHTITVEPGEDLMAALKQFTTAHNVHAAHISGLGAASEIEIAYYNLETKTYEHKTFTENVEICSLNGNVGINESGETVVHMHGVFGRRDFSTLGGHVVRCIISGAGEVHIATMPDAINRAYEDATGLTLMQSPRKS